MSHGCVQVLRRIENRVRIPDGAAAICVRAGCVDESQSLGNWEGSVRLEKSLVRESEDLLEVRSFPRVMEMGVFCRGKTAAAA